MLEKSAIETSDTVHCKSGYNWLCRFLQNKLWLSSCKNCTATECLEKKNAKNNTFINYYQYDSWSALLHIIDKQYTDTMQWSIQSLIIRHHHDILISGLISLLLFSSLHNLIVFPSLCRVDNLSLYVLNNSVTQSRAAQMAEVRIWKPKCLLISLYKGTITGVLSQVFVNPYICGDYLHRVALRIYTTVTSQITIRHFLY